MQWHGCEALGCAGQRECGVTKPLRVAPLFETLDDLDHSESAMEQLLSNKWCAPAAPAPAAPAPGGRLAWWRGGSATAGRVSPLA